MPYIGHNPTNAGSFIFLDDIASGFNNSETDFTLQVGGVSVTPNTQNLLIALDGVIQQAPDAYTVSGSTISFTAAVPSGTDFYGILMGQSASIGLGTIGADELKISGNGTNGQLIKTDGDGTFSYINQNTVTASTAATLATARTINGVSFDGSGNITVTADANTLSNTTLKSTVVNSSLTSVGTLSSLNVSGNAVISGTLQSDDFTLDAGAGNPDLVIKTTASSSATAQALFLTGSHDFTLVNDTANFRLYNSTPGIGVDVIKVVGSSSDILFGDVGNSRHVSLDYSNGDFVVNQKLGVGVVPPYKFTVKSGGAGAIAQGFVLLNNGDSNIAGTLFEESTNPTSGELRLYSGGAEKVYLRANSSSSSAFWFKGGQMQDITANNTGIQYRANWDTGFINKIDNNFDGASAASSYMRFKVASGAGSQNTALTLKGDGTIAVSADTSAYAAVIQNNQGDGAVLDLYASSSDDHAFDPIFKVRTDADDLFMIDNAGNWYSGDNFASNPWDASGSSNYGSLFFQHGSSSLGQTFATATNVSAGGGYANWYSNIINASSTTHRHVQWMNDGTSAGTITWAASNQVAYNTSQSDKTLKKNFANWTENVLDSFDKINPQLFHFKIQKDSEEKIKGFIAQDMLDKFPEAYPLVAYGEGDNQTEKYQFNPSGMVVYLMKAVKELSDKIKVLEAK